MRQVRLAEQAISQDDGACRFRVDEQASREELSISEVTVKLHRSSATRKLGEKSVARLARIAHVLDMRG